MSHWRSSLVTAVGAGLAIFRRSVIQSLDNRIAFSAATCGAADLCHSAGGSLDFLTQHTLAGRTHCAALRFAPRRSLLLRPGSGPILDTIYAPLSALLYFPALIFSAPVPAVPAGAVIELLLFARADGMRRPAHHFASHAGSRGADVSRHLLVGMYARSSQRADVFHTCRCAGHRLGRDGNCEPALCRG